MKKLSDAFGGDTNAFEGSNKVLAKLIFSGHVNFPKKGLSVQPTDTRPVHNVMITYRYG